MRFPIEHRVRALMLAASLFAVSINAVAAPAARRPRVPLAARRTITAANAEWLRAMKRQDIAGIVEPYDQDAVFVAATGEAVRGRPAIERLMRDRFAKIGRVVGGTIVEDGLTRVGTMIYEWGHADLQLSRDGGKPTVSKGRYLTVWKPDASGHWRIIRNLSLPE
jgi:ketosteroid isomerase-like protein